MILTAAFWGKPAEAWNGSQLVGFGYTAFGSGVYFYISGWRTHLRHIFGGGVHIESGRAVAGDVQRIYLSVYRGLSGAGARHDSPRYRIGKGSRLAGLPGHGKL